MKYAFFVAEDINLGVGYLISHLKAQGHEAKLFFDPLQFNRGYARLPLLSNLLSMDKYNIRKLKKFNPDKVLISCVTATYGWALKIAEKIKTELSGVPIVLGGVHPTLVPEECKKHDCFDEVIVGDGFEYFGGKFEPDKIFPDREIFLKELPPEHRRVQLFMTSFGCPFNCSYCGNEQLRKVKQFKYIRRSAKGCIDELKIIKDSGARYILFVDDIFTSDKHFLSNFLPLYKKHIGLPFACFIHPRYIDDKIAKQLKESGCHFAWLGIQTANQQLRKDILNRPENNQEIVNCCKAIKDNGIKLMIDHIFGIPFENNITQEESYGLYSLIKPDVVNCYEMLYFPKSKIIEHALRFGYLSPNDVGRIERGEGIVYQQGNQASKYYDTYAKAMVAIPLGGIVWELLPMTILKLIIHIKAGRGFIIRVVLENELFFTWRAILKKLRLI